MKTITEQKHFPNSETVLLGQDGALVSEPSKGIQVILHTREGETDPCCVEVISGDHYAEIGLTFEAKKLTDYDGVFNLPREVGVMLRNAGYIVPRERLG